MVIAIIFSVIALIGPENKERERETEERENKERENDERERENDERGRRTFCHHGSFDTESL